ncbi:dolichyl-phosphate-mannose-protein mannosyltransferase [Tremella mesenterica]|uniref:Dolichyl-phosphate-mannose--protein mannosyltransferase n=1 Tax=Tremella mesenterica TaxID=5217 RepID=A0A4Q1BVV1_TREME|nr:dolichyl-phosphate-mannose-protein mannosyltransferase [Tremella mesenterica]
MSLARKRKTGGEASTLPHSISRTTSDDEKRRLPRPRPPPTSHSETLISLSTALALTTLAFVVRFYRIGHPDQVVFDEVHFGAFAGQYLRREYYFDVHPPFAKLLNALGAWLVGFKGDFGFDNIGDSYTTANVPYVGMRSFCAVMGSVTVPVVYAIMRESGYPVVIAAFSALLVLFDNGHVTQTRLILLDAALVLFMSLSLLCYIKFHQQRYREFSKTWWFWLICTGLSLACTLGCKMVGVLTFATVGVAVLWDLWGILDIKKNPEISYFYRHFAYRALGLILIPFLTYLAFFWVHFKILIYSGPGDSFMSPAFQETLQGNQLLLNAQEIRYYDTVTLKHKDTKQYLHSHLEAYPLRYEDGRISSQGQQVTCYPHNDTNNHWQILPTKEIPDSGRGRVVRHNDIIQLRHINSDTLLLTHDVASPLMPTNQEFTTVVPEDEERHNDTLFQLNLIDAHSGEPWRSLSGHFKLIHVPTKVLLWTHAKALPEWAFGQQEVNGNKNMQDRTTAWFVEDIIEDGQGMDFKNRTGHVEPKVVKKRNFFKKFFELQILMLQHNAGLTAEHPYASNPIEWPFCLSGISFWTDGDTQQQIYMIGNLIGWWITAVSVSVYVGIVLAEQLARRRGIEPLEEGIRNRLYRNTGYFFGAWAFHYFPFFLMARQRFLHHYLPAHLAASLIAGSILNFVLVEEVNYPVSVAGLNTRLRPAVRARMSKVALGVVGVLALVTIGMFLWEAPLTYGIT